MENPVKQSHEPILVQSIEELLTPGVVVEVEPDAAEAMGAFAENALSEEEAWEANTDLGGTSHEQ